MSKSPLNPAQQIAVDTIHGPLLINAGAGSGKTHTVTQRVVSMIHDHGISPASIFCVTFTNKAAREMRERIAEKLGFDATRINPFRAQGLPTVGTFHSVSAFFLRMFIERLGIAYTRDFVIYDTDDCISIIRSILKSLNIDEKEAKPRNILGAISTAKGKGIDAEHYGSEVDSYFGSIVHDAYRRYTVALHTANAIDFDDILLYMRRILDVPDVLEYFHSRFQYFTVDEYQDTNILQYEIVKILASKTRNLCVVGDDWQGIYSWRGADIANILSFQKDYPEALVINLEQNYRSTQHIINAANALIQGNKNQMKKNLWTENEIGKKIYMIEGMDEKHEAELVISSIKESGKYADWAVLYRTNGQSRLIEESLIRKNIPYQVFGGMKFYERKEIKDILAYIRVVFNPYDMISMSRIINVPSRKIGETSIAKFRDILSTENMSIYDIAKNIDKLDSLPPAAQRSISGFLSLYLSMKDVCSTQTIHELMKHIVERIGYIEYLKSEYTEDEVQGKVENIDEFMNMASRYDGMIYPENIQSFLEDIALITDADTSNANILDKVSLMTIHLSKGLEYPCVAIVGVEEGIFPHSRTLTDAPAVEEERRLMYVAMTRAKKELYISRALERYTYGNYSANPKSRFIKEIPEEYIEKSENMASREQAIFGKSLLGYTGGTNVRTFAGYGSSTSTEYVQYDQDVHNTDNAKIRNSIKLPPNNKITDFVVGDRVEHKVHGVGTIVGMTGAVADIAFSGSGVKKMQVEIAPIWKV